MSEKRPIFSIFTESHNFLVSFIISGPVGELGAGALQFYLCVVFFFLLSLYDFKGLSPPESYRTEPKMEAGSTPVSLKRCGAHRPGAATAFMNGTKL